MPVVGSGDPEMEKRISVGNKCLERRVWKALIVRLISVRETKKFIGKGRDVTLETTSLRHLTKFGHLVAVWNVLTEHAQSPSLWRVWPYSITVQRSYFSKNVHGLSFHLGFTNIPGSRRAGGLLQGLLSMSSGRQHGMAGVQMPSIAAVPISRQKA